MGWWSKKIDTPEHTYNVWETGNGRYDVHRQGVICNAFGELLGSTDTLTDAVRLVEAKTGESVRGVRSS